MQRRLCQTLNWAKHFEGLADDDDDDDDETTKSALSLSQCFQIALHD